MLPLSPSSNEVGDDLKRFFLAHRALKKSGKGAAVAGACGSARALEARGGVSLLWRVCMRTYAHCAQRTPDPAIGECIAEEEEGFNAPESTPL